jgi:hypothetical protein
MNGAQRQTITAITENIGYWSSQLGPGFPGSAVLIVQSMTP